MMKYNILIFILFIFFVNANSQNSKNKIIKESLRWSINYATQKKFDSSNKYINRAISVAREINDTQFIGEANYTKALVLYWQDSTKSAKKLLLNEVINTPFNDSILIKSNILLSEIYKYENQYTEGISHLLNAEKLVRKRIFFNRLDSLFLTTIYIKFAQINKNLKNINKSLEYFDRAILFNPDKKNESELLFMKSNLFFTENKINKAIQVAKKAISIEKENRRKLFLPTYYLAMSNYYLKLNKGDSAVYYGKKGLYKNDYCQLDLLYKSIGEGYMLSNEHDKAIVYFNKSLSDSTDTALSVHKHLRDVYISLKQYKKAIFHNEKYLHLKDSIDALKIRQEIQAITEKYESEKKQMRINTLQSDNIHKNIIIKKQKNQLILITISFILFVLLFVFSIVYYLKQRKQQQLLFTKNRLLAQNFNTNSKSVLILSENKSQLQTELSGIDFSQKQKIHTFVEDAIQNKFYLNKTVSLSSFAKEANTNTTYLSKVINEDYKKTFSNFVNELRISYTLKQLELYPQYRELTIENIADKAGFSSSSAFYIAFKKHTGLTPSFYIKKRILQ